MDDGNATRKAVQAAVGKARRSASKCSCIPAVRLGSARRIRDHRRLVHHRYSGVRRRWGKPFLLGPGTIHVAHTTEERIPKRQLVDASRNCINGWCGICSSVENKLCNESKLEFLAPPAWSASIS